MELHLVLITTTSPTLYNLTTYKFKVHLKKCKGKYSNQNMLPMEKDKVSFMDIV